MEPRSIKRGNGAQSKLNKELHLARGMRVVASVVAHTIRFFSNTQVISLRPNDLCIARGWQG